MKTIRRKLAPHEVQDALVVLTEIGSQFNCSIFETIKNIIENDFLNDSKGVVDLVKQGVSPRVQVYNAMSNLVGDMVESGHYHVYRGVLNSDGENLLQLFDFATDSLVAAGSIDSIYANKQKAELRKNIQDVG
jgi:hypothetical protein